MAVRHTSSPEEVPKFPRPSWREKEDGLTEPNDSVPLDEPGISIFLDAATDPRFGPGSKHKTRNLDRCMLVVSSDVVRDDFESPHGYHEVFPPNERREGR